MQPENIKIISAKIDRETKEGKIEIEVEEVPQSVNLLAKFFLKERSESDPEAGKLEEMDDYFMQVYQKNTGNSFSFARLKAIEAVLIKYGYQLEKEIPDMIVGVWIKVSDKKPNSWDRVPVRFIHTQLPIYDGRVYAEQHPELIEWLEPIQLKDLLAK